MQAKSNQWKTEKEELSENNDAGRMVTLTN